MQLRLQYLSLAINLACTSHVPDWNEYVAPIINVSLFWQNMWKDCGCPHSGVVVDIMIDEAYSCFFSLFYSTATLIRY